MAFHTAAPYRHGQVERTGILLCNLGSPDEPTPAALRRYLGQFLSDRRVVEIPRLLWWLILNGIILRVRPAKSAHKYASIWTDEGSPLVAQTIKQAKLLHGYLGQAGHHVVVKPAMRYGSPAIAQTLDEMCAEGVTRVLVLPLYPQYSATTTASVFDAVGLWAQNTRRLPELRFVNRYHKQASYIEALANSLSEHWQREGRADVLVMSFHGLPERNLHLGDPYHCECLATARLVAERLSLKPEQYRVTFQSRFGRAKWLQPYTEPTLVALAEAGVRSVDVICPGFAADCLETLEEINQEARAAFINKGGREFRYVPCLNSRHDGMQALTELALQHLQGWPTGLDAPDLAQQQRALALGATQ